MPPTPRTAAPGDTPFWRGGRGSQQSYKADQQSGEANIHKKAEGKKKLVLRLSRLAEEIKTNTNPRVFFSPAISEHFELGVF